MLRTIFLLASFLCFSFTYSQNINQEVEYGEGKTKLLGLINKNGLMKPAYAEWFTKNYQDYDVNTNVAKKLKDSLNQYTIKVFLGTWCGDSKRQVPRFYNVLESAKFPENQLEVFALDSTDEAYKQGPNREEKGMGIHRVPTFIFYKDGKEVNRIVERPVESLERDMLAITTGQRYTPNYVIANLMYQTLATAGIDSLRANLPAMVDRYSEYTKGSRELNTLGNVYLGAKEYEKALFIFDMNAKMYPYKARVYSGLGETYFKKDEYDNALKSYYKVLSIDPENENAKEMIDKIIPLIKVEEAADHSH